MSINAIVCYESDPTGVTKMNAKWLIMKPFGFFVFATGKKAGKIGTVLLMRENRDGSFDVILVIK